MKKNVNPAVLIGALVAAVAILGFAAYKTFGPRNLPDITDEAMRKKYMPGGYPYPVAGKPGSGAAQVAPQGVGNMQQQYQQHSQQKAAGAPSQ